MGSEVVVHAQTLRYFVHRCFTEQVHGTRSVARLLSMKVLTDTYWTLKEYF